ncbi:MAG: VWA domain-containing protein [Oligoflexia bacterium]|nr:VWA domain-containing protein [Oligoflexia bacterium]
MTSALATETTDQSLDLERFQILRDLKISGEELQERLGTPRGAQETQDLRFKIVQLARLFSSNYGIKVLPSDDGRWSLAVDRAALKLVEELNAGTRQTLLDLDPKLFEPKAIFYNLDDIALAPEEQVLAKLRLEATGARTTDFRYLFEGQKFAKEQGISPDSFGLLQTALERVRVLQKSTGGSTAAKQTLAESMAERLAEIDSSINQLPPILQFTTNLVYGRWLRGADIPNLRNPKVLEIANAASPLTDSYMLEPLNARNYALLCKQIWPLISALEPLGIEEQIKRGVALQIATTFMREQQEERKFQTKLSRTFQKLFRIKPKSPSLTPAEQELKELIALNGGEHLKRVLTSELKGQGAVSEKRSKSKKTAAPGPATPNEVDLSVLPPEIQSALDTVAANLNQSHRATLESAARLKIGGIVGAALKRELPAGITTKSASDKDASQNFAEAPSDDELQKKEDEVARLAQELGIDRAPAAPSSSEDEELRSARANGLKKRAELQRRRLEQNGFTPAEETEFRNYLALERSVTGKLQRFVTELAPFLPKKRTWGYGSEHFFTGSKLDTRVLARKVPVGDLRIQLRRIPIDSTEPRMIVALLVDNTKSMLKNDKIGQARKAAVFMARALKSFGIPFAITLIGEQPTEIKRFDQDYDNPIFKVKPKLMQLTSAKEEHSDIGAALLPTIAQMNSMLKKHRDHFGAVFVFSDGGANKGLVAEDLVAEIRKAQEKYVVMNFNLANDAPHIREAKAYFGERNVVAPSDFHQLPDEALRALAKIMRKTFHLTGGVRS